MRQATSGSCVCLYLNSSYFKPSVCKVLNLMSLSHDATADMAGSAARRSMRTQTKRRSLARSLLQPLRSALSWSVDPGPGSAMACQD